MFIIVGCAIDCKLTPAKGVPVRHTASMCPAGIDVRTNNNVTLHKLHTFSAPLCGRCRAVGPAYLNWLSHKQQQPPVNHIIVVAVSRANNETQCEHLNLSEMMHIFAALLPSLYSCSYYPTYLIILLGLHCVVVVVVRPHDNMQ